MSDCVRYVFFACLFLAGGFGNIASWGSRSPLVRSTMSRTLASRLLPSQSHGHTGRLAVSSGLVHLSARSSHRMVRAVTAFPLEIFVHSRNSNGGRRRSLSPSHQLSVGQPADALCTTLFLQKRIRTCGDLGTAIVHLSQRHDSSHAHHVQSP